MQLYSTLFVVNTIGPKLGLHKIALVLPKWWLILVYDQVAESVLEAQD